MAAHRYWRLRILTIAGATSYACVNEFQMRETVSGSDVTGSGTAIASSELGGNVAANAFDNNNTTYWESTSTAWVSDYREFWIGYDFGSGNDKNIEEIVVRSTAFATEAPSQGVLEYSDDGSTWYGKHRIKFGDFTATPEQTVATPQQNTTDGRRYWRILISASYRANFSNLSEIEFRATIGGANFAYGCRVRSISNQGGDGTQYRINDGDTATFWENTSSSGPWWVSFDLGPNMVDKCAQVMLRGGLYNDENPQDFKIQYSDDNSTWVDSLSVTGEPVWSSGEVRTYSTTDSGSTGSSAPVGQARQLVITN